jgi:hypothetical protein
MFLDPIGVPPAAAGYARSGRRGLVARVADWLMQ